jgi:hypothetical protein
MDGAISLQLPTGIGLTAPNPNMQDIFVRPRTFDTWDISIINVAYSIGGSATDTPRITCQLTRNGLVVWESSIGYTINANGTVSDAISPNLASPLRYRNTDRLLFSIAITGQSQPAHVDLTSAILWYDHRTP